MGDKEREDIRDIFGTGNEAQKRYGRFWKRELKVKRDEGCIEKRVAKVERDWKASVKGSVRQGKIRELTKKGSSKGDIEKNSEGGKETRKVPVKGDVSKER